MIARLEGTLLERTPTRVVIDVRGVGYEAWIPLSTFSQLPDEGKTVALRIFTHVREDALVLYGFASEGERAVFELLLHASGVGPKLAQRILSGIDASALVRAIRASDLATLRTVPGVGAKLAEKICVELRERAIEVAGLAGGTEPARGAGGEDDAARAQLISALLNLQTPRPKAERVAGEVIDTLGARAELGELVRAALRRLAR
ncbi:MAG TPA: Holliday junction branch migration protein RuvA [Myxococcota bacterium]|nr:Holliday junction branch migration protein RuvA [Myxococcota bacterium]